jgi:XTP/dITP diphosphohydrolase
MKLLVATTNANKIAELREMLAGLPIDLVTPVQAGVTDLIVEETGETFEENAILKARAYATRAGLLTLADDSGLEVATLGGQPGVHSARFAGPGASAEANNALLLQELERTTGPHRARFRCVLALVDPHTPESPTTVEGRCDGAITFEPRGKNGFGYDPLFVPDAKGGRTMAELASEEKHAISHRGRAYAALRPALERLAAGGTVTSR